MLVVALATVATSVACGEFDRETISMEPITGNGTPAPAPSGSPVTLEDASTQSLPDHHVLCAKAGAPVCTGAQVCCIRNADALTASCIDDPNDCIGSNATLVTCRIASDCPAGTVCCASNANNKRHGETYCATKCATNEILMCDDAAEKSGCAPGMRCTSDKLDDEYGIDGAYDACRPKADAGSSTSTTL